MLRPVIEVSGRTDFLKDMVTNLADEVSELTPVLLDLEMAFWLRRSRLVLAV